VRRDDDNETCGDGRSVAGDSRIDFDHLNNQAQSVGTEQTAIRAALTKWTEDFNAGNVKEVCGLFALDLRYNYKGFPERNYQEICDGLYRSLTDQTRRYAYSLTIKEIIVSSDLTAVRLTWTLRIEKPDAPPQISHEHGIDIFRKQSDDTWKIIRFIAYDEPA
jgi:ketosteroid isomerase-like protein